MKKITLALIGAIVCTSLFAQFGPGSGGGSDRQGTRSSGNNNSGWGSPSGQQQGQRAKGTAKITGFIMDSASNKPVEFANIALFTNGKLIDGSVADEKGKFVIEGLGDGNYKIQVSFLGYNNKAVDNITVKNERNVNLQPIKISENSQTLNEVTVTGAKAIIEEKVDRIVYNAEKDQLAKGGDATDVLKKVPMLQVDLEGNVSMRGSSSIKVLINNKPSTIIAASIADALRQLPADQIKTVEVITSPTARYDAEGAAGIINIIMKKDKMQGYTMGVDLGAGLRSSNLGLNGSYRSGKFGVTLGGHGRAHYNPSELTMSQFTLLNNVTRRTEQSAEAFDLGYYGRFNLGMDYDIDKTQSISGNISYGGRGMQRDQDLQTQIFTENVLKTTDFRDIVSTDRSGTVDVNLDYLRTFSDQKEWSISSQYSRSDLTNNFISDNQNSLREIQNRLKNENLNVNQEVTFQTDFQTPVSTNQMWEVGAKGILRSVNSDFAYFTAQGAAGEYTKDALRPTGILDYGQNIGAAYSTYTFSTANKFTIKAGLRYELTSITAKQNNSDINIPDYQNFVPSFNISKSLKNNTTLKAAFNRRIQRPGLQQLNPNRNFVNAQNVTEGNPLLNPELSNNIEMGISSMMGKTYVNVTLFSRFTDNAINQVRKPLDSASSAILTTYQNVGKQESYGTNFNTNIYLTNTWSINAGADLYYSFLEGQVEGANKTSITAKNQGWNISGRVMTSMQLKNGWGFQAFGFMRGQQVELQGKRGGFGMYSVGARKDFKNKKGSIGISTENFLQRGWNIRSELYTAQFNQISDNLLLNRSVRINLNYRFGKINFVDSKKKAKGIRNDDVKDGGGGGEMQGGGEVQGGGQSRGQARPQGATQGAPQGGQGKPQGATQGNPNGGAAPQGGQGAPQQGGQNGGKPQGEWKRPSKPEGGAPTDTKKEGKPEGEAPVKKSGDNKGS
jgi:outer membrane receptor protein involved in Fe transport